MNIPPDLKDRIASLEKTFAHVPSPILSLLAMLPTPESEFPSDERADLLRSLACVFNVVYGAGDDRIEVETV